MMTKPCVIFDLDGTLADVRHRLHHVRKQPPDWQAFFDGCVDDEPHAHVVELNRMVAITADVEREVLDSACKSYSRPIEIFVCSGRPDSHKLQTQQWLADNEVCYDYLLMRKEGDHRPDVVVKKEMLDGICGQGYEPLFAVDDRPSVVRMWRENGVPCFACDDSAWREPQDHLTEDLEGKTLLTLMVGPSHGGKSTWLCEQYVGDVYHRRVLSSDQYRAVVTGDLHNQEHNQKVFSLLHDVARARLNHGVETVIDATHLRRKDRMNAAALAPAGTRVRYVVIDRPLANKLAALRPGFPEAVVRKHDQTFRSQLKDILAGDGLPYVDVVDLTKKC